MPTRRAREVAASLIAKGMTELPGRHHHRMFRKKIGDVVVLTRISHGAKDLSDLLLSLMAKQCYLRPREFADLVDCPFTEDAWNQAVLDRAAGR